MEKIDVQEKIWDGKDIIRIKDTLSQYTTEELKSIRMSISAKDYWQKSDYLGDEILQAELKRRLH